MSSRAPRGHLVCAAKCDQCLFSRNKIVSDSRRDEILAHVRSSQQHFECHKHTIKGNKVQCRGDYDRDPAAHNPRLARALGVLKFVDDNLNTVEDPDALVRFS